MTFRLLMQDIFVRMKSQLGPDQDDALAMRRSTPFRPVYDTFVRTKSRLGTDQSDPSAMRHSTPSRPVTRP
jgi:hypothetical protein